MGGQEQAGTKFGPWIHVQNRDRRYNVARKRDREERRGVASGELKEGSRFNLLNGLGEDTEEGVREKVGEGNLDTEVRSTTEVRQVRRMNTGKGPEVVHKSKLLGLEGGNKGGKQVNKGARLEGGGRSSRRHTNGFENGEDLSKEMEFPRLDNGVQHTRGIGNGMGRKGSPSNPKHMVVDPHEKSPAAEGLLKIQEGTNREDGSCYILPPENSAKRALPATVEDLVLKSVRQRQEERGNGSSMEEEEEVSMVESTYQEEDAEGRKEGRGGLHQNP